MDFFSRKQWDTQPIIEISCGYHVDIMWIYIYILYNSIYIYTYTYIYINYIYMRMY